MYTLLDGICNQSFSDHCNAQCFLFQICEKIPDGGGRVVCSGSGLVEVEDVGTFEFFSRTSF